MNSKQVFLRQGELVKWWVSVARDNRFEDVLTHARSTFMEMQPSQPEIAGAEKILNLLVAMVDGEESNIPFPSPGLHHEIDSMPERGPEGEPKKAKRRKT